MRLKKYALDKKTIELLDSLEYMPEDEEFYKAQIRKYLANNLPIEILVQNFSRIKNLGRDSSSLESYIIRYGEELGQKMFETKLSQSTQTKEKFIEKYGYEEATKRLSRRGASLENYINRHGEKIGKQKWDEYCKKRAKTYEQGKKEKRYASRNEKWYINRYGDEVGRLKWKELREKCDYKSSRQYWIDRYGETEGTRLCKENKTRNLESFIRKYGIADGTNRYNQWLLNIVNGMKSRKNYSIWALDCCEALKAYIPDLYYYGQNELIWMLPKEYRSKMNQKIISPDLFYRGKIIEFNGDLFHGNPKIFQETDTTHPFRKNLTVKQLCEIDTIRYEYYISKDYQILEVWENDYYQNKEGVIDLCREFLK